MQDAGPQLARTVMVLGASGMLGHTLVRELPGLMPGVEVWGTVRSAEHLPEALVSTSGERLLSGVDVLDLRTVETVLERYRPDVLINAVGVVKQVPGVEDHLLTATVNGLLPHQLARACGEIGARLVQVSTDCVFSGRRGAYTEDDVPDPVDFYGRSKLLGEVTEPHVTLRTSIIGHELGHGHSLLEWFLSQRGQHVRGFTKAVYSGLPTVELARVLAEHVLPDPGLAGLWHVSSSPITKYELLRQFADTYQWEGHITPDDDLACDRSLVSQRFADRTGYIAPDWPELVAGMEESQRRWRQP